MVKIATLICNKYCITIHIQSITETIMRTITNISLPPQMATFVEQTIATGKYASKSEFFRSLLRPLMDEWLTQEIEQSRHELASGKGKQLHSLRDLR